MNPDNSQILQKLLSLLDSVSGVRPDEVPNIDLYMDQVTTFMDAQLASSKRYKDDKILTKTMINNYAKNDLLPPPVRKKYSREHMVLLILIYYFKNILTIADIQTFLNPVAERYFGGPNGRTVSDLYKELYRMEKADLGVIRDSILGKFETSKTTFADAPEEEREFLQLFSFLCLMCYDIYIKKQVVEHVIDDLAEWRRAEDPKKKN